jgi:hypothetical protein
LLLRAQTSGVLTGTVRDEAGTALANALVVLDAQANRQSQRTDANGVFRFRQVTLGEHELTTLWIGYRSDVRTIQMAAEGLDVQIVLHRNVALVDTMHVTARRSGIYGTVVEHKDLRPLPGVEVQIIGSGLHSTTTRDGHFQFPLMRPGAYVVHLKRDRYTAGMISVIVPRDSALELYLSMEPVSTKADKKYAVLMGDFDRRVRFAAGSNNAAIIPRQELAEHQGQTLFDALRYSMSYLVKGLVLDDNVCMYVNGVFQPAMSAKDYPASDIEAVEVYGSGADFTGTVTARTGSAASSRPPGSQCGIGEPSLSQATGRRLGVPARRPDPARVEAIVIWTK